MAKPPYLFIHIYIQFTSVVYPLKNGGFVPAILFCFLQPKGGVFHFHVDHMLWVYRIGF